MEVFATPFVQNKPTGLFTIFHY